LPRGRKPSGPPSLSAPHRTSKPRGHLGIELSPRLQLAAAASVQAQETDPHTLIDAALQGWIRDARVRRLAEASRIARRSASAEPSPGSWIDAANHPRAPKTRGRSSDHYRPLVIKAIELLIVQHGWTRYRARRHVADRLLSVVSFDFAIRILDIPTHVLTGLGGDARHAAARKWIIRRLEQIEPL
jgi:hypothetical protein